MTDVDTTRPTSPSPPRRAVLPPRYEVRPLVVVLTAVALLVGGWWLVCRGQPGKFVTLVFVLFGEGMTPIAWFASAMGWGWLLRRVLLPDITRGLVVQTVLGAAVLLLIGWLLAWFGWQNQTTGWLALGFGWIFLIRQGQDNREVFTRPETWPALPEITMLAAPAAALAVGAATVAPGVLWASEARGYDVLSYHLQLPREWLDAGGMVPLEHNVYSFLPNVTESAYMLLGAWHTSIYVAVLASQLLHVAFALLAAVIIAQIVTRLIRQADPSQPEHGGFAPFAGTLAGAAYLAVPWTTVTGSMAYNEQSAVALAGAALLIAVERRWRVDWRTGAAAGLLCGMSMMCKPSTMLAPAVFVAALILIARTPRAALVRWVVGFAIAGAIPIGLWMLRNAIWCGNPTFPMLTDVFGQAHWTDEQVARWSDAHMPALSLGERLDRVWTMGSAHLQFGFVLWPVAAIAAVWALARSASRQCALAFVVMFALLGLWWMFGTHLQSRFLIPLLIPACVVLGLGIHAARPHALSATVASLMVVVLSVFGYTVYLIDENQPDAFRGGVRAALSGGKPVAFIGGVDDMSFKQNPYLTLNGLPPGCQIYAEGFATPFYAGRPVLVPGSEDRYYRVPLKYHTVWDASPLGPFLDANQGIPAYYWMARHGYTHLLLDQGMLQRWLSPGNYGYDPQVSMVRLRALERRSLQVGKWGRLVLCFIVPPTPLAR